MPPPADPTTTSLPLKDRLKKLMAEYGPVAIVVWFALFLLTWAGFSTAIAFGFSPEGAGGSAGVLGGGYVATQLTKPVRIGVTLVVTPLAARVWKRLRGHRAES